MYDETALREELLAAQMKLELGEITEEEFARDRGAGPRRHARGPRAQKAASGQALADAERAAGEARRFTIESVEANLDRNERRRRLSRDARRRRSQRGSGPAVVGGGSRSAADVLRRQGRRREDDVRGRGRRAAPRPRARACSSSRPIPRTRSATRSGLDARGSSRGAVPQRARGELHAAELDADKALDALAPRARGGDPRHRRSRHVPRRRGHRPAPLAVVPGRRRARRARRADAPRAGAAVRRGRRRHRADRPHAAPPRDARDARSGSAQVLDDMHAKHRFLASSIGGAWRPDFADAADRRDRGGSARLRELLRDRSRASVHLGHAARGAARAASRATACDRSSARRVASTIVVESRLARARSRVRALHAARRAERHRRPTRRRDVPGRSAARGPRAAEPSPRCAALLAAGGLRPDAGAASRVAAEAAARRAPARASSARGRSTAGSLQPLPPIARSVRLAALRREGRRGQDHGRRGLRRSTSRHLDGRGPACSCSRPTRRTRLATCSTCQSPTRCAPCPAVRESRRAGARRRSSMGGGARALPRGHRRSVRVASAEGWTRLRSSGARRPARPRAAGHRRAPRARHVARCVVGSEPQYARTTWRSPARRRQSRATTRHHRHRADWAYAPPFGCRLARSNGCTR